MIIDPRSELVDTAAGQLDRLGISLVAVVGYGLDALEAVYRHQPDLVLIRVAEPLARPLQLIERLSDALPDSPIIGVTAEPSSGTAANAVAAGAFACVSPGHRGEELAAAIKSACAYAERRRRDLTALAEAPGSVITVLGAKGGVGKTTVAANLAVALAQECNDSVALIDADPAFGDVALALDVFGARTLADVASEVEKLDAQNARDFMTRKFGLWILPSRAKFESNATVSTADFERVVHELRRAFDFVVVDTNSAMTDLTYAATALASTRILVTTPESTSIRDARQTVRLLRSIAEQGKEAQLLLNRAGMAGGRTPEEVEEEVGLAAIWLVKDDARIAAAMQAGVPAVIRYEGRGPSETFRRMAETFAGTASAGPGGDGRPQGPRLGHGLWPVRRSGTQPLGVRVVPVSSGDFSWR